MARRLREVFHHPLEMRIVEQHNIEGDRGMIRVYLDGENKIVVELNKIEGENNSLEFQVHWR